MANRTTRKRRRGSPAHRATPIRSHSSGSKNLGRATAGAVALALFLPVAGVSASAAVGAPSEGSPTNLTVKDLASVSKVQIQAANSTKLESFSSQDLITSVANKIEADRNAREKAREEARIAAEKAKAKAEAEAKAKAEAEAKEAAEAKAAAEAAQAKAEADKNAEAAAQAARSAASSQARSGSQAAAATPSSPTVPNVPSTGALADRIVAAAKAQVGVSQDCTDLVQNTLAAVGLTARRDQGGYDLGTGIWQYDHFGPRIALSDIQPGDILIYGNAGTGAHVAIYIGNGQAVHGGFNGNTVIYSQYITKHQLTGAIRPGA